MTQSSDNSRAPQPWRVSLHGGHSGDFCDHAEGSLRDILEAAVAAGYHTFGVSEHAPRYQERFLYPEERAMGWDLAKIADDFERYTAAIQMLAAEFDGRLRVLRGFEAEVVPDADYVQLMTAIRDRRLPGGEPVFDYFVGSVHFVGEIQIDASPELYQRAADAAGGPEALAVAYYSAVAAMVEALRPPVVGHLDLIKRNYFEAGFTDAGVLQSNAVKAAAQSALEAIASSGGILDLNTAGWRKGLGEPYPAPWLLAEAARMEVPLCFGDDSHRASDVGAGVEAARQYLLVNGVNTVTVLTRSGPAGSPVERRKVALQA